MVHAAIIAEEYGETWMNPIPFNEMVATMEFQPCGQKDVHTSQSTCTNVAVVRLRGGVDSTDLTEFSLPNGILRGGLPTTI
eukprot:SAG11_NODE_1057_length_6008_cov_3.405991_5_plen_81_part_00